MNNTYDFFGMNTKKKRKTVTSGPFFFLGNTRNTSALSPSRPMPTNNYLGIKKSTNVSVVRSPSSFIGKPSKEFSYGKPLYKKEKLGQKHLSKWGDVDMDGSPNYFDCDPVNFLKDAKKLKKGKTFQIPIDEYYRNVLESTRYQEKYKTASPRNKLKMVQEETATVLSSTGNKKQRKKELERLAKTQAILETRIKDEERREENRMRLEEAKKRNEKIAADNRKMRIEAIENRRRQQQRKSEKNKQQRKQDVEKRKITRKEESVARKAQKTYESYTDKALVKLGKEEKKMSKLGEKKEGVTTSVEGILAAKNKGIFTLTSPQATQMGFLIEQKVKKGKMPTAKELDKYSKMQRKKLFDGLTLNKELYKEKVITMKEEQIKVPVLDKFGKPVLDARGEPEYVYGKAMVPEAGYKYRKPTEALYRVTAAAAARGVDIAKGTGKMLLTETYGKEERARTARVKRLVKGGLGAVFGQTILNPQTSSKGRPRGPSGRYKIEGKPVFEEEYQRWAASQRAMNRITPSVAQEAPMTYEQMQSMVAQPSTAEQQIEQMAMVQQPSNEKQFANGNVPMTPGEIEASKYREEIRRGPTNEEVKMAQELAQQQDNILNAPSFMKGELKATGGSLLTSVGPQIMDAPNAFKGELRNLNRGDPSSIGEVKVGERPQTNPYGDEYIDIELGSGKPVLKKRPREKWVTGEAL